MLRRITETYSPSSGLAYTEEDIVAVINGPLPSEVQKISEAYRGRSLSAKTLDVTAYAQLTRQNRPRPHAKGS